MVFFLRLYPPHNRKTFRYEHKKQQQQQKSKNIYIIITKSCKHDQYDSEELDD